MNPNVSLLPASTPPSGLPASRTPAQAADKTFAKFLQTERDRHPALATAPTRAAESTYTVNKGDTLVGIVRSLSKAQGSKLSDTQAYRQALRLAASNQIQNPDLILPGQVLRLEQRPVQVTKLSMPPGNSGQSPTLPNDSGETVTKLDILITKEPAAIKGPHPVLEKTLARAIDKGYLAGEQATQAASKILALSEKYRFEPDDFARLTLLESGGMNPQASNGNCHGIIQFCDGANRGAAAVGMRNNPRDILGMGLIKQLDLVDAYFDQLGLAESTRPLSLDELYLTVLRPAARTEQGRDNPLAIPGRQARLLHVGGNRNAPITRNSIVDGLNALAQQVFGPVTGKGRHLSAYASMLSGTGPR